MAPEIVDLQTEQQEVAGAPAPLEDRSITSTESIREDGYRTAQPYDGFSFEVETPALYAETGTEGPVEISIDQLPAGVTYKEGSTYIQYRKPGSFFSTFHTLGKNEKIDDATFTYDESKQTLTIQTSGSTSKDTLVLHLDTGKSELTSSEAKSEPTPDPDPEPDPVPDPEPDRERERPPPPEPELKVIKRPGGISLTMKEGRIVSYKSYDTDVDYTYSDEGKLIAVETAGGTANIPPNATDIEINEKTGGVTYQTGSANTFAVSPRGGLTLTVRPEGQDPATWRFDSKTNSWRTDDPSIEPSKELPVDKNGQYRYSEATGTSYTFGPDGKLISKNEPNTSATVTTEVHGRVYTLTYGESGRIERAVIASKDGETVTTYKLESEKPLRYEGTRRKADGTEEPAVWKGALAVSVEGHLAYRHGDNVSATEITEFNVSAPDGTKYTQRRTDSGTIVNTDSAGRVSAVYRMEHPNRFHLGGAQAGAEKFAEVDYRAKGGPKLTVQIGDGEMVWRQRDGKWHSEGCEPQAELPVSSEGLLRYTREDGSVALVKPQGETIVEDPAGRIFTYQDGQLESVKFGDRVRTYEYDDKGRLERVGGLRMFDEATVNPFTGDVTFAVKGKDIRIAADGTQYHSDGDKLIRTVSNGGDTREFKYEGDEVVSITETRYFGHSTDHIVWERQKDTRGRYTDTFVAMNDASEELYDGVSYTYDSEGRVESITYPDSDLNVSGIVYDDDTNAVIRFTDSQGRRFSRADGEQVDWSISNRRAGTPSTFNGDVRVRDGLFMKNEYTTIQKKVDIDYTDGTTKNEERTFYTPTRYQVSTAEGVKPESDINWDEMARFHRDVEIAADGDYSYMVAGQTFETRAEWMDKNYVKTELALERAKLLELAKTRMSAAEYRQFARDLIQAEGRMLEMGHRQERSNWHHDGRNYAMYKLVETYRTAQDMMSDKHKKSLVPLDQRTDLVRQGMHLAAAPTHTKQCGHPTCNVTVPQVYMMAQEPQIAFDLVRQGAIGGNYTTPEGRVIDLPDSALTISSTQPEWNFDVTRADDPDYSVRSHFSKIFQNGMVNIRHSVEGTGYTYYSEGDEIAEWRSRRPSSYEMEGVTYTTTQNRHALGGDLLIESDGDIYIDDNVKHSGPKMGMSAILETSEVILGYEMPYVELDHQLDLDSTYSSTGGVVASNFRDFLADGRGPLAYLPRNSHIQSLHGRPAGFGGGKMEVFIDNQWTNNRDDEKVGPLANK